MQWALSKQAKHGEFPFQGSALPSESYKGKFRNPNCSKIILEYLLIESLKTFAVYKRYILIIMA